MQLIERKLVKINLLRPRVALNNQQLLRYPRRLAYRFPRLLPLDGRMGGPYRSRSSPAMVRACASQCSLTPPTSNRSARLVRRRRPTTPTTTPTAIPIHHI